MIYRKWKILLVLILLGGVPIQAQTDTTMLSRILGQYTNQSQLYLEIENKVYEGNQATTETIRVSKLGEKHRYETSNLLMLFGAERIIIVDKRNLNIIEYPRTEKRMSQLLRRTQGDLQGLLKTYSNIKLIDKPTGEAYYHLSNDEEDFSDIEIHIDKQRESLKKCVYRYNPKITKEKIWLEIIYKTINIKPSFSAKHFDESQIITANGTLASRYQKYTIVNQK
jgi:hypothetical protein